MMAGPIIGACSWPGPAGGRAADRCTGTPHELLARLHPARAALPAEDGRRVGVHGAEGRQGTDGRHPAAAAPPPEAHRAAQAKRRLTAGELWDEWDLVFSRADGRPIEPRDDWEAWKKLLRTIGIRDSRLHDARHTAATLLLEQGVDIRVVQEILGHSTLAVTKRYTHVTNKLAKDAAERMGRALWDVR